MRYYCKLSEPWFRGLASRSNSVLSTGVFLFLLIALPARAGERQTLHGHVPAVIKNSGLQPVGDLDESRQLNLAISLPLRNSGALTNFLTDIYDPQSANYRHYLTPDEFTAQFGPTEADYQALIVFATTNGLKITGTHPNRALLDVSGPVADIKRALGINLRVYQHPTEARTFYAPDTEPSVDAAVSVLNIAGLNNLVKPRPLFHKQPPSPPGGSPRFGSAPDGLSYLGSDFRSAYVPGTALTGTGQIVALFELDGYVASDITAYENLAGQRVVPLTNVLVGGFNGVPQDPNGESEVDLDIEMAVAMAPGLTKVMVYEGAPSDIPPNDILAKIATDNAAKQISCSWGFSIDSSIEQTFKQYAAQGQSFYLASGDSGAYLNGVEPPSDDPYITIVGGTTLTTTGAHGAWVGESTWNWGDTGGGIVASSGGISTVYSIPVWQQGINMTTNLGSTTFRNIPDVSLTGDGCWVVYDSGQSSAFGGTSAAAPLWAGLTALMNQQATAAGKPTVGFVNPAIYALCKGTAYSYNFHDVTSGNNIPTGTARKFSAVPGFDLCTGWGTPNGTNLINSLAPVVNAPLLVVNPTTVVSESCLPANGAIDPGETVTVSFPLLNIGTARTTNLVATLLPLSAILDPSGPQTYGTLTNGGAAVARQFTFTAAGSCGQTITAGLQLQDGATSLGTVLFKLTLGKIIPATALSQNFDGVTAPALPSGWTTSATGAQSKWVTSTANHDSAPNAAFATDAANPGVTYLVSPTIAIVTPVAQLTFRHKFSLEAFSTNGVVADAFDGGTLDIAIGSGAFKDILVAGGSFAGGGYNATIDSSDTDNPLVGRAAWSGVSTGWVTTTVNLPAAAAGQNVKLRWACGTDTANEFPAAGWYVDTITLADGNYSCCGDSANLAVFPAVSPAFPASGENVTYTFSVTNAGPDIATDVILSDTLPANVTFVSASGGLTNSGGVVSGTLGDITSGGTAVASITVLPAVAGSYTNTVTVVAVTPEGNAVDNTVSTITDIEASSPIIITTEPTNEVVVAGATASFQVAVTGPSPGYQWFFNGATLSGATNATLAFTNAQPALAGNYTVVITNSVNSATSTVATLRVLVPPSITAGSFSHGANPSFSVNSVSGLNYTLEYKNSLTQTNWTPIPPPVSGTGGAITLQDTNAISASNRFYRIIVN